MFGPYEIEYEGRKYFGNVSLREFHKFRRDDGIYLFLAGKMDVKKISEPVSVLIDKVSSSSGGLIPAGLIGELRKLDLLDEDESDMAEDIEMKAGNGSGTDKKAEFGVKGIALFIAQQCNMKCVYCYGEAGEYGGKGMMSRETACRAVDWLIENSKSAEKVHISFFGGEPLLNFPLMRKTVEYAKEKAAEKDKKVSFGMTTNASLLTREIIEFIKQEKINPLISFDGPAWIQNRQRPFKDGSGSHDVVCANIHRLLAVLPEVTARATAYGGTDPFEIKEGMKKAGLKNCVVVKASPVILDGGNGGSTKMEAEENISRCMMAFQEKEFDAFLKSVKDRTLEMNQAGYMLLPIISGEKRYYGCGLGKTMVGISVCGDIYPCHRFAGQEDMKIGNIRDHKIEGVNEYHRTIVDNLPQCSACWARYLCGGGCFYDNKSRTGDMRMPDVLFCNERKSALETALYMSLRLDEGDKEYIKGVYRDRGNEKLP